MANLETIKNQVYKFLETPKSEVLAIQGEWGIGKTYTWEYCLKKAKKRDKIKLDKYAYVSLFGITSVEQLRFSIFEKTIDKESIGENPSLLTFRKNLIQVLEILGKNKFNFSRFIPWLNPIGNIANVGISRAASLAISYLSVNGTLICLDDFERSTLDVQKIIGVISELKEKKDCKIVLIFNESNLFKDSLENYRKYKEKIIDKNLNFNPTNREILSIRFSSSNKVPDSEIIKRYCLKLSINNIRTFDRIIRLWSNFLECKKLEKLISSNDFMKEKIISSLILFTCSIYKTNNSMPDAEFIKKFSLFISALRATSTQRETKEETEKERQEKIKIDEWNKLLEHFRPNYLSNSSEKYSDALDSKILSYVENGYLIESEFVDAINQHLTDRHWLQNSHNLVIDRITKKFHDESDTDELMNQLYESTKKYIPKIYHEGLTMSLSLLRHCGHDDKASDLIKVCVETRDDANFFLLAKREAGETPWDKEMEASFAEAYTKKQPVITLDSIFNKMPNSLDPKDIAALEKFSEEEYYDFFKSKSGDYLIWFMDDCSECGNAIEAIRRLTKESKINDWLIQNLKYTAKMRLALAIKEPAS